MNNPTQLKLLQAFDESAKKTVAEICKIAGVTPSTFWFHFYKDSNFKKEFLRKREENLKIKIAAIEV